MLTASASFNLPGYETSRGILGQRLEKSTIQLGPFNMETRAGFLQSEGEQKRGICSSPAAGDLEGETEGRERGREKGERQETEREKVIRQGSSRTPCISNEGSIRASTRKTSMYLLIDDIRRHSQIPRDS